MKKQIEIMLILASKVRMYWHIAVMVVIIAMFVLAAGAPNATIGIGK